MKKGKRIFSFMLAVLLLVCLLPTGVFAADAAADKTLWEPVAEPVTIEYYLKNQETGKVVYVSSYESNFKGNLIWTFDLTYGLPTGMTQQKFDSDVAACFGKTLKYSELTGIKQELYKSNGTQTVLMESRDGSRYCISPHNYSVDEMKGYTKFTVKMYYGLPPENTPDESTAGGYVDIPVRMVDFPADGMLFEYGYYAGDYRMSTAGFGSKDGVAVANPTPNYDVHVRGTGLVETELKRDGDAVYPVYKQSTVQAVANMIAAKDERARMWQNSDNYACANDLYVREQVRIANGDNKKATELAQYMLSHFFVVDKTGDKPYGYEVPQNKIHALRLRRMDSFGKGMYVYDSAFNSVVAGGVIQNTVVSQNGVQRVKPATYPNKDGAFYMPLDWAGITNVPFAHNGDDPVANPNDDDPYSNNNFLFSTVGDAVFIYKGGETFSFCGDDDVYLFINDKLAVDLGGAHTAEECTLKLDDMKDTLGLEEGNAYRFTFFHMERHGTGSVFRMATNIELFDPDRDINIDVEKITEGTDIPAGRIPDSITVNLVGTDAANQKTTLDTKTMPLDAAGKGNVTFTVKAGDAAGLTLDVEEVIPEAFAKYFTTVKSGNAEDGFTITNTYVPQDLTFSVTKKTEGWADIPADKRPAAIQVQIMRDGVPFNPPVPIPLDENGSGTASFTIDEANAEGHEFTVQEIIPAPYSDWFEGTVTGTAATGFVITNRVKELEIIVNKVTTGWADIPDADKPQSIDVQLLRDGTPYGERKTLTLDENGSASCTFTIPGADAFGSFDVKEFIPDEYKDKFTSVAAKNADGFTITNTHITKDLTIEVKKTTVGENIPDARKLSAVTVNLVAADDGGVKTIVETQTMTLDAAGTGSASFTVNPDAVQGKTLSVEEVIPDAYKRFYTVSYGGTVETGLEITNTYDPDTISIFVAKKTEGWASIPAADRPASIGVQLLCDGVEDGEPITLTLDENGSASYTFTLDAADAEGHTYDVREIIPEGLYERYNSLKTGDATIGFLFTNVYIPRAVSFSISKVTEGWADIPAEKRPASIQVQIMRDGEPFNPPITITLDAATGSGKAEVTIGEADAEGHEFTVQEIIPAPYDAWFDSMVSGSLADNFTITNRLKPLNFRVSKVTEGWANIPADKRPASIQAQIMRDGVPFNPPITIELDAATGSGQAEVSISAAQAEGHVFTLQEIIPAPYDAWFNTTVSGDTASGFTITNIYVPQRITFRVSKVTEGWADIPAEKRPASIQVQIMRDGEPFNTPVPIPLDENGSGHADFTIGAADAEGHEFTVQEIIPAPYDAWFDSAVSGNMTDGFIITNTPKIETGTLSVSKTVTGAGSKTKEFSFVITFDAEGSFPYSGSRSGTLQSGDTVKLKSGEKITIADLPVGTTYTVTEKEANQNGYTTTAVNDSGAVTAAGVTAAFTNHKQPGTPPPPPTDIPKTSDPMGLWIWVALMGISAAGTLLLAVLAHKRRARA